MDDIFWDDDDFWDDVFLIQTPEFRTGCVATFIMGLSLLFTSTFIDLTVWGVVVGFACVGLAGPFVFVLLSRKLHGPSRALALRLGYALFGVAVASIALVLRGEIDLSARPINAIWTVCLVFGLFWAVIFLTAAATATAKRQRQDPLDEMSDYDDLPGRTPPTSAVQRRDAYDWTTMAVAVISAAATVAGLFPK